MWRVTVTVAVGALCGYFLANSNLAGFVLTVITGLAIIKIMDKISRRVVYDERDKFIASLASHATILATMISMGLLTIIFAVSELLNVSWLSSLLKDFIERYAPFVLYIMIIYVAFWIIFKFKYS